MRRKGASSGLHFKRYSPSSIDCTCPVHHKARSKVRRSRTPLCRSQHLSSSLPTSWTDDQSPPIRCRQTRQGGLYRRLHLTSPPYFPPSSLLPSRASDDRPTLVCHVAFHHDRSGEAEEFGVYVRHAISQDRSNTVGIGIL